MMIFNDISLKIIKLTIEKKVELEARHDASRDDRVRDRIKAVLLRSEGWSIAMIDQALRLHETTIVRHIDDFINKDKLTPGNGGSQPYLNQTQTDDVVAHIMQNTYRYSYEIIEYIGFSISGLNKWLHQHDFSYKYPKGVPHKSDEEKQENFIEEYTELKAKAVDKLIFFIDAMHPTQATKVSCGWIKKGQGKAIETTGSRTRLNLVGAINLNDLAAAHVRRYDKVNGEIIQHFFTELRTHYLPPYSPNLNPIERLWKVRNEHVRNNKYFATAKEFRDKIDEFFSETLPTIGDILETRINDNFQVVNSVS